MAAEPIRVVIADDTDFIRKAISKLLRDCKTVKVIGEAEDYATAMTLVATLKPEVLVADMHMPGEVDPATFKKSVDGCCLIAMSIWNDEETKSLAESYGALRLIDKTELSDKLVAAIEECAARPLSQKLVKSGDAVTRWVSALTTFGARAECMDYQTARRTVVPAQIGAVEVLPPTVEAI